METLRQRLKEKDETIERQLQTVKTAQQDKKNSDSRFHETAEHMKVKERKICVLQRKVIVHFTLLSTPTDFKLSAVLGNRYYHYLLLLLPLLFFLLLLLLSLLPDFHSLLIGAGVFLSC